MIRIAVIPLLIFLAGPGLLAPTLPASAEVCNRVVAVVNGDVITLFELNSRMEEMTGVEPEQLRGEDEQRYLNSRRSVLNLLIDEKIAQEKIRELGIRVTADQVDAAIERLKQNNGWTQEDLIASLDREGLDYQQFRERIREQLERRQLINREVESKIVIREEELKEYYDAHPDEFSNPAEVRLAAIMLVSRKPRDSRERQLLYEKAEQLVERIQSGADFGSLARKHSQGPGAREGGDLGFFNLSQLDPQIRTLVENMSPGDVSDPIPRPGGVQILKLLERRKQEKKSFEEVKDGLYERFYQREINNRYAAWLEELREKAYTKIVF